MDINVGCSSAWSQIGVGSTESISAGNWVAYSCSSGTCTTRAALAELHIQPVSAVPSFPTALIISSMPTTAAPDALLGPVAVLLEGALDTGALYT
jgi:hypothetical protein